MHPRQSLPGDVLSLLRRQAGAITTAQLMEGGISRRVLHRLSAAWLQPARGIHVVGPPGWLTAVWAGALQAGMGGVVGAAASCFLHGVVRDEPDFVVVWAPGDRRDMQVGRWRVLLRKGTKDGVGTPPRMRIDASLLDLAACSTEMDTVGAITRAFVVGATTPSRLLAALRGKRRQRHSATIRTLRSCGAWRREPHRVVVLA